MPKNGSDPFGQSFFVDEESGIFVTSVDVFFRSKDDTSVTAQLRSTKLVFQQGTYPFSEVVLDPDRLFLKMRTTKINLNPPVYLTGGEYHSLVLLSDSNEYTVWILDWRD